MSAPTVKRSGSFDGDDLEAFLIAEGLDGVFVAALDNADRSSLIRLLRRAMHRVVADDGGQAATLVADLYLSNPALLPPAIRDRARR